MPKPPVHARSLAQAGRLPGAGGESIKPPGLKLALNPRDRRLLEHLIKGFTMDEAAESEGMKRGTANMRLTRARKRRGIRSMIQFAALLAAETEREKHEEK